MGHGSRQICQGAAVKSFPKSRIIQRESFSEFEIVLGIPHGGHKRLTKFLKLLNLVIEVSKVLTAGNKWRSVPAFGKTAWIRIREKPAVERSDINSKTWAGTVP